MDTQKESAVQTWDDLEALLVLYVIYEVNRTNNDAAWSDFNAELLHNHRFFPKENDIIKAIQERAEASTLYFNKGHILYRARIFNKNPYARFMDLYRKELRLSKEQWDDEKEKIIQNESIFISQISMLEYMDKAYFETNPSAQPILRALKKWQKLRFKGFNRKDSLPPPNSISVPGRANPEGIRYTYLCEDEITPIYEVRPTINQIISVAKFKVNKQLKIYDIDYVMDQIEFPPLFSTISEKFSMPYNGNPSEYFPTQYLTEFIRTMGFDGIRFNSSLHKNGKNVVLFNMDYDVISSNLVTVKNYNLDIDNHDIYTFLPKKP